ncbi:glycosyltransferase [Jiangella rhizosphaerae]|uniref:Glycosyltransferase family 2 protein n=1 Tax=Jiangella rhizosphaerae TaxID=2293569 RepID=A0A418KPD5_9ACTN|nr:glycosyltransferase family 2 protein [Jiangella rhizosphaerae]RIQ20877.1 glycosyltransferase family 2 protein [Jiangella rhizosphaerae]
MITSARRVAAKRNDWRSLMPRALGDPITTPVSVSVIIPAHNDQPELDLALAALAAQSHPAELLEVVVVDDRSEPPLRLPESRPAHTTLVRVEGGGHGSGHARDVGARRAGGDVLLFIDADIIADRHHVEAHARWHEIIDDAVVLGFRDFVDVGGITVDQVRSAVEQGDVGTLVEGRPKEPHLWIDQVLEMTDDLTTDREDLWRPVVGASVSTRSALYEEMGGFAHFPRRGIVDTEFGYRCFTAGGVIIPERAAYSLHQGQRSFAINGAELARKRAPLIANYIANPRYRPPVSGRQWAVPYLRVVVPPSNRSFSAVRNTVDDILANDFDDLAISVVYDPASADADLYVDYWQSEGRVRLVTEAPRSGFPSPATMMVPVGTRLAATALSGLMARWRTWTHGLISISVTGVDAPLELWATRALHRSYRVSDEAGLRDAARELFGEAWVAGADHGVGTESGASDHRFAQGRYHLGRR